MRALGTAGEEFAARRLQEAGCEVVARNWRSPEGELDLVVVDGRTSAHELAFCEVKTRHSSEWGMPGEAVDWRKQRRLRAVASAFLRSEPARPFAHLPCRFDVIEVLVRNGVAELDWIEDAF